MTNSSKADLYTREKDRHTSFHTTPAGLQMPSLALNTRIDVYRLRTMLFIILGLLAGLMTTIVSIKLWRRRRRKRPASCKLTKSYPGCNLVQRLIQRIRVKKSSHCLY